MMPCLTDFAGANIATRERTVSPGDAPGLAMLADVCALVDERMAECYGAGEHRQEVGLTLAVLQVLRETAVEIAGPEADRACLPVRMEALASRMIAGEGER